MFFPFFVDVDAIGILPIYPGLTQGLTPVRMKNTTIQSPATASTAAIAFLLDGPLLLMLVGVGVSDFMVAGGIGTPLFKKTAHLKSLPVIPDFMH